MKRIYTVVSILACLAFYGCDKSEENIEANVINDVLPEFTASTGEGDTKTSLKGLDVIWSSDDRVAIFNGTTVDKEYKVKDGCSGSTTTTLTPVNQDFTAGTEGSEMDGNVAVYPYSAVNSCRKTDDGYKLSVNFPSVIRYSPYSFGEGAMPMVAVTDSKDDYNLSFKNLCGLLKLQLKGDGIKVKSIRVMGHYGETLAGDIHYNIVKDESESIFWEGKSEDLIEICFENEMTLTTATDIFIPMLPNSFKYGLSVFVNTDKGTITKSITAPLTIKRSQIVPMKELNLDYSMIEKSYVTILCPIAVPYSVSYFPSCGPNISFYSNSDDASLKIAVIYDGKAAVIRGVDITLFGATNLTWFNITGAYMVGEILSSVVSAGEISLPEELIYLAGSVSMSPSTLDLSKCINLKEIGHCNQTCSTLKIGAKTPPIINSDSFSEPGSCTLYVPAESIDAYKAAEGWKEFKDIRAL